MFGFLKKTADRSVEELVKCAPATEEKLEKYDVELVFKLAEDAEYKMMSLLKEEGG